MKTKGKCPRCEDETYERFSSHAYCHSCNYSPDFSIERRHCADDLPIPPWALEALKQTPKTLEVQFPPLPNRNSNIKKGSAA